MPMEPNSTPQSNELASVICVSHRPVTALS
jgi:hypothetical protein